MESYSNTSDKTVASFIHLSTFSKYILPLGNFILPLVLWTAKKQDPFVDEHGKQALNFQISTFLYFIFLVCLGIAGVIFLGLEMNFEDPFFISDNYVNLFTAVNALPLILFIGLIGILLLALFIIEIIAVITATVNASEGKPYKYPITINFIIPTKVGQHQSKNEQFKNTQNETL